MRPDQVRSGMQRLPEKGPLEWLGHGAIEVSKPPTLHRTQGDSDLVQAASSAIAAGGQPSSDCRRSDEACEGAVDPSSELAQDPAQRAATVTHSTWVCCTPLRRSREWPLGP